MAKILFVEDDQQFSETVQDWLERENHLVETSADGFVGKELILNYAYDLIILDWDIPGPSGLELLRVYRSSGGGSPILMMTGATGIDEKETGFDSGADDYVTKPVHPRELMARVRALLRRGPSLTTDMLSAKDVVLDPKSHKVSVNGVEAKLHPKEFALLEYLLRNKGHVYNADQLLNAVWKVDEEYSAESIRTCITRLRQKIDKNGRDSLIRNIYGVGYTIDND